MKEKPVSLMKLSLKYGIYLGIVLVLVSVVLYVFGYNFENWAQYTTYPFLIAGIILAQLAYRKALADQLSYGQAIGVGVLTALFASIFVAIYSFVLYKIIDPSLQEQLVTLTEQKILEQGKVSEEQLDTVMNITKKFLSPIAISMQIIFSLTIAGLIISLITGIFTKKAPNNEVLA